MIRFIYAIRDSVSGQLSDICTAGSDAEMSRALKAKLNASGFPRFIARDLCAVCLGEYDASTGVVSGYEAFRPVAYGSDLLEPEKENND